MRDLLPIPKKKCEKLMEVKPPVRLDISWTGDIKPRGSEKLGVME